MTYLLMACLVVLSVMAATASSGGTLTHVNVYKSGEDGYAVYRIPTIETAPDGSLLAFAEARKYNGGDPGQDNNEIDLVLKRSTDGGRTWSAMGVVEHAGERWSSANAATVVDRTTRRVWVLYLRCKPGRGTEEARPGTDDMMNLARYSDDNGVTWSDAIDLTRAAREMDNPLWAGTVPGPGGAIQTRKGRLVVACWRAKPYLPFCLYSDDHGRTWSRGQVMPGPGGNECQVVELADGRLLLNIRQNEGTHRWTSFSSDGGHTWSVPREGESVSPVACAIERYTWKGGGGRDRLLWTGPKGPSRNKLVARLSYDEGDSFAHERVITEEPAAYSDLTLLKDGQAGVLWERAEYKYITFTVLPREFLEPK